MVVFQKLIEALKWPLTLLQVFLEQNSPKLQENKREKSQAQLDAEDSPLWLIPHLVTHGEIHFLMHQT